MSHWLSKLPYLTPAPTLAYNLAYTPPPTPHLEHGLLQMLRVGPRLRVELLDDGWLGARQYHRVHEVVVIHHHTTIRILHLVTSEWVSE